MSRWDTRFAEDGFAYGSTPNDFVAERSSQLKSPVLCLAAGEGRNAVFLAEQGFEVHAVDLSSIGLNKCKALAAERGVELTTEVVDLADYDLGEGKWGSIVAIFAHLPPPLRAKVHAAIANGLAPGGVLLMEMYAQDQLQFGTGGPPKLEMLYTVDLVKTTFPSLTFSHLEQVQRSIVEGRYHTGEAAVVQVIGHKA